MNKKWSLTALGLSALALSLFATGVTASMDYRGAEENAIQLHAAAGTTAIQSKDSFTVLAGNVGGDANISFTTAKNSAGTNPGIYNGQIRLYQGNPGGSIKLIANNDVKITSVVTRSGMATTLGYVLDGEAISKAIGKKTVAVDEDYVVDNIEASSVEIGCFGSSKTTRYYVSYLAVTYVENKSLVGVAIEGDMAQKTYYPGDEWNYDGLTVTGTYDNGSVESLGTLNDVLADTKVESIVVASPEKPAEGTTSVKLDMLYGDTPLEASKTISDILVKAPRTATDIELVGDLAKKDYFIGDSWVLDGLKVRVNYDDETHEDLPLNDTLITCETNPATANSGDITSFELTVHYNGNEFQTSKTYAVSVTNKPVSIAFDDSGSDASLEISAGDLLAYMTEGKDLVNSVSDISKVYKGKTGLKFSTSSVSGSITLHMSDAFKEKTVKAILVDSALWKEDAAKFTIQLGTNSIDVDPTQGADKVYELAPHEGNIATITISATQRAYLKGISFILEDAQYAATDFAKDFLDLTGPICNLSQNVAGTTTPEGLADVWTTLKAKYETLSTDEKTKLANGGSEDATIVDAMLRYVHIISRYDLENFINGQTALSPVNQFNAASTTKHTVLFSVLASLGLVAAGAFFFTKKRKGIR